MYIKQSIRSTRIIAAMGIGPSNPSKKTLPIPGTRAYRPLHKSLQDYPMHIQYQAPSYPIRSNQLVKREGTVPKSKPRQNIEQCTFSQQNLNMELTNHDNSLPTSCSPRDPRRCRCGGAAGLRAVIGGVDCNASIKPDFSVLSAGRSGAA